MSVSKMSKTNAHSGNTLAQLSDNDTPEDPLETHSPPQDAFRNRELSTAENVVTRQPSIHVKGDDVTLIQSNACHPGLEYLATIDQLTVEQKLDILAVFIGFQTENEFSVTNSEGQKLYSAVESSGCCGRFWLGGIHSFEMKIKDIFGKLVMNLRRPVTLCDYQTMEVNDSCGNIIGSIEHGGTAFKLKYNVKDSEGNVMLEIKQGTSESCGDRKFDILTLDGKQVGLITKHSSECCFPCFTDADDLSISFDLGLDVKMKALLFAAVFLINAVYFESNIGCLNGQLVRCCCR